MDVSPQCMVNANCMPGIAFNQKLMKPMIDKDLPCENALNYIRNETVYHIKMKRHFQNDRVSMQFPDFKLISLKR